MTGLEANTYINAAMEALQDDPEYRQAFDALVKERTALQDAGVDFGRIEGILFEIWNQRIGYILDHLDELRPSVSKLAQNLDGSLVYQDSHWSASFL